MKENRVGEKKIRCCRCGKKIPVKIGQKIIRIIESGIYNSKEKMVNCRNCGTINHFSVDKNGKVHGPKNKRRQS